MTAHESPTFKPIPYLVEPGEPYMGDRQRAHFRALLLAWQQQLMEGVDRTVAHMQDDVTHYPDPNDRATQESDFGIELRARDRERKLLRKIGEALREIETGEYGYCEACGAEIGLRRLEARPTATLCIECKTFQENHERRKS